jgi:hypothetical protein
MTDSSLIFVADDCAAFDAFVPGYCIDRQILPIRSLPL